MTVMEKISQEVGKSIVETILKKHQKDFTLHYEFESDTAKGNLALHVVVEGVNLDLKKDEDEEQCAS